MSDLKRCPFCGGEPEIIVHYRNCFEIACRDCGCRTRVFEEYEAADCFNAWNRRCDDLDISDWTREHDND